MENRLDSTTKIKDLMDAQEIAAMLKGLPEKDRFRLEGVIIGVGLMHKEPPTSPPTDRPT